MVYGALRHSSPVRNPPFPHPPRFSPKDTLCARTTLGAWGGSLGQQGVATATAAHSGGAGVLGSGRGGPRGLASMPALLTLFELLTF